MIRTSHYLFAALCLGSLFACSRQFTDSYIVPKWCFAVFMLFIVLAYEAVNILFYRQNEQKDTRISVYGFIIVISCFLQAMFGVVQFFGFFQISTTLWVTGSFDNPCPPGLRPGAAHGSVAGRLPPCRAAARPHLCHAGPVFAGDEHRHASRCKCPLSGDQRRRQRWRL